MTDIQLEQVLPGDIERRSFELIQEELSLQGIHLKPENEMVIKRAIPVSYTHLTLPTILLV